MSEARPETDAERIEREAAAWMLARDRGLTAAEQDRFSEWLAADPRHAGALARQRRTWQRLDGLAEWRPEHSARPNPDLLAPPLRRKVVRFAPVAVTLAAAAAVMLTWALWTSGQRAASQAATKVAGTIQVTPAPNQRVLADGTIVELNQGAELEVSFSSGERRVTLERGEAHFAVTKDETWPFVVRARGVDVRAVGTAFNVRVATATVEVLVTEGRVRLETQRAPGAGALGESAATVPVLEVRQRAVVPISEGVGPTAAEIATLTAGEVERVLAWQHRLLDFTAMPLHQVVAEFNRRNVVQLVVIDPELAAEKITATFRSDNLDGFVRLLEVGFGAKAEKRGETELLLRKAK